MLLTNTLLTLAANPVPKIDLLGPEVQMITVKASFDLSNKELSFYENDSSLEIHTNFIFHKDKESDNVINQ